MESQFAIIRNIEQDPAFGFVASTGAGRVEITIYVKLFVYYQNKLIPI